MKGLSSKPTSSLSVGSMVNCIDNSGAKTLEIIAVRGYKGIRRSKPKAGIASLVMCKVIKGNEKVRHQVFKGIIVRQKKEYRRSNGLRIRFDDNAAVLVDDKFEMKGTIIKGPVAKEAVERFPLIGKIANMIV